MNVEDIFGFTVYFIVALIMFLIGVVQLRSKEPVGFYSGEKPPKREEIKDVEAWNKKHGTMWVSYGITIMCSWLIGLLMGDTVWCVIPMCGGILIPIFIMICYHHKLIKIYKV